ncbi:uncharacterized protein LOC143231622 isoform X3 [Tachypleus tridentatus]
MKVKTGQSDEVISEFQESDIGEPDSSNDDILSVKKEKESENEFYQLGSGLESTLACVQPSENYQCPEGLTLRNNLCYPSQPGTEEETYVPSPRKTPSMSKHTIPLVTAAVGIPLLLIALSVIIWKCNSCGCETVKLVNTEDHTNKDDRKKLNIHLYHKKMKISLLIETRRENVKV